MLPNRFKEVGNSLGLYGINEPTPQNLFTYVDELVGREALARRRKQAFLSLCCVVLRS